MRYHVTRTLRVPAERVWATIADLPSWPHWTPTVEAIDSRAGRPEVGADVTIKQPGRAAARYVIDMVEEGRRFRWGSDRGGVKQSADHTVDPVDETSCVVTLTFEMTGPIGRVLGALGGHKIRTMVDTEALALLAAVDPDPNGTPPG